jgi:glycosyltransferase involved in cell wall biosynthesis
MMDQKRKPRDIVWVAQGIEGYGVLAAIFGLAKQVRAQGDRVRILTMREGPIAVYARQHGYECECLEMNQTFQIRAGLVGRVVSLVQTAYLMVAYLLRLRRWLRRHEPDYVHIVPNILAVPAALAGRLASVRPIWEMSNAVGGGYPLSLNKRFYQIACRLSDAIVLANSRYSGTTVAGWGVDPIVFHLGVDSDRFIPKGVTSVQRAELGLNETDVVLGLFARLVPEKGLLVLLEVVAALKDEFPHLKVLVAGGPTESDYAQQVEAQINHLGLGERVRLLGPCDCLERYYQAIDIAVNFRIDPEPFGLSVIEAMLMEVPVLAHAAGGPGETIVDNVTGWLLPDLNVAPAVARLREILTDSDVIRDMGGQARVHALKHFTTEVQCMKYTQILDSSDE